ncbi:MAG TPA: efflux RND transporter periplasmic adaptor subunit [Hyphomicrobiaceae bacterium]|nr:efflux RND transporter periplasmic adaptor subunit [Hyphomicrobiaceae bacterium]
MAFPAQRSRILLSGVVLALAAAAVAGLIDVSSSASQSGAAAKAPPSAVPVSVATVERREVTIWNEFSGRLEAVERVDIRSRVAGAVQKVHFREGALVAEGDLLVSIDPAPFAAEVERLEAQVGAAEARLALAKKDLERSQQLQRSGSSAISESVIDQRLSAHRQAEAELRAAQAALELARLNLGYTEVRAPVAGRVGKLEITVGNLIAAGPGAPVLTTMVSVDPIYASFNADEEVVMRALKALGAGANAHAEVERIPVEMTTATSNGTVYKGRLQLIDNQVDVKTGTVRVRAVFANPRGELMPGQFARLRMGQPKSEPALLVSERAIGTDQNKKFVLVVDAENKAVYREVALGPAVDGLRMVRSGIEPGERIVVNGLQRVRPGALVAPELVAMDAGRPDEETTGSVAQR